MIYLIMRFEIEFYSTEKGRETVADFMKRHSILGVFLYNLIIEYYTK